MLSGLSLKEFVSPVAVTGSEVPPNPVGGTVSGWCAYMQKYFRMQSLGLPVPGEGLQQYPLLIGALPERGPVLVRHQPSLLSTGRVDILSLDSGLVERLDCSALSNLTDVRALIDTFDTRGEFSVWDGARYLYHPVRRLKLETTFFFASLAGANALIFIAGYQMLLHIVPNHSREAYLVLLVLAGIAIGIIFAACHLMSWGQALMDSYIEERRELLRYSLLGCIPPQEMRQLGPAQALRLCTVLAATAKTASQMQMALTEAIAFSPFLVLLYLRMPSSLFLAICVIALAVFAAQVAFHLREQRHLEVADKYGTEERQWLGTLVTNAQHVGYYGLADRMLFDWRRRLLASFSTDTAIAGLTAMNRESRPFMTGMVQFMGILGLTVTMVFQSPEREIGIGEAYLLLLMLTGAQNLIPKILEFVKHYAAIGDRLKPTKPLLDIIGKEGSQRPPLLIESARTEFSGVRLPHGCEFESGNVLNLSLDGRSVVQVCGESGSGKTTFLRCLMGLESPLEGSIRVMGVDPRTFSASERWQVISYVGQDSHFFPGTVGDQLRLFAAADDDDRVLWDALARARIVDQVKRLPLGLDTPIGQLGRGFSTGEKQRLLLAQIFIKPSRVLILDEAMSGLPPELEKEVFDELASSVPQIFFVSHRTHYKGRADVCIKLGRGSQG